MAPKQKAHRSETDPNHAYVEDVKSAVKNGDTNRAIDKLDEAVTSALTHKRSLNGITSGLISSVLYSAFNSNFPQVCIRAREWFEKMYISAISSPSTGDLLLPFDERIGTLGLRLLHKGGADCEVLLSTLRLMLVYFATEERLSSGRLTPTRRLFTPLLEAAAEFGNATLALGVLREAHQREVELRDEDVCLSVQAALNGSSDSTTIALATAAIIEIVSARKPFVGGPTAVLVQKALPGSQLCKGSEPTRLGVCANCQGTFGKFRFPSEDRERLLQDISQKLVKSHCDERIRSHPDDPTATTAFAFFQELTRSIDAMTKVPAVLDGANVGFFGLSSWYEDVKREVVSARGGDLSQIPNDEFIASHLKKQGLPTDVSPNFAVIDAAINAFAKLHENQTPVVFLHSRHLSASSFIANNNASFVAAWRERGIRVVTTPNHVNDDMCWLYAAIRHECPVISNDQMRDHHAKLLAPQAFVKWRATNRIRFTAKFEGSRPFEVRLFEPPKALVWISVATPDQPNVQLGMTPSGIHIPYTASALVEDKGKINPGAVQVGQVMVPESDAEVMDFALRNVAGWICAPAPYDSP